jgi:(2Fe-2S) ferredoxin
VSKRKRYLFVCTNRRPDGTPKGSCAGRGAEALHQALKAEIALRGLAATELRACTSSCIDVCWAGPIVHVSPDGVFYGRVTEADVPELVDTLAQGEVLERLRLPAEDFDAATALPGIPETPSAAKPG